MTSEPRRAEAKTLVVDDHAISSRYTVAALRQSAGSVKQAGTAGEALSIALSWFPELIFMDINLPDSNGLAAIRKIRTAWPEERPRPRIVILTAADSAIGGRDLTGLEIDRILLKPVAVKEILEAARIQAQDGAMEDRPFEHKPKLQALFLAELAQRLPELDRSMSKLDWRRSAAILHQLIASSALCGERRLEMNLRSLDSACREGASPARMARACYAVFESSRAFTNRTEAEAG